MVALNGPDRQLKKQLPTTKGPLTLKQLNKLYVKMQKNEVTQNWNENEVDKWLKKALKSDNNELLIETVYNFKKMYDARDGYCKEHDIDAEYVFDHLCMYELANGSQTIEEQQEKIEDSKVPDNMMNHRLEIFELMKKTLDHEVTEKDYKEKSILKLFKSLTNKAFLDKQALSKQENRLKQKEITRNRIKDKFTLKRPMYENCIILAPDGEVLCKCDKKKIEWYLERELATLIKDEPLTAKLTFEPSGRGAINFNEEKHDDVFYVENRENIW
jgi:hypothetical protein